jgi:hypothetical protein
MSSGHLAKLFCTTCILDKERFITPSWAREQASMQDMHPWHFFISTSMKPNACLPLPLNISQPAIYTPATARPEYLIKSLRETIIPALSSLVFLLLIEPPYELKRDMMQTDELITLNRGAGHLKRIS